MTSISGTSASSPWANVDDRSAQRQQRMFARADSNGDGSVDKTELQAMLDKVADKTGTTALNADDLFAKLDSDGSGGISSSELDTGMKSLMPPPPSTVDFAQQRGGDPDDADADTSGDISTLMQDIFKAADTNGDGTLSKSETDTLKTKVDDVFDQVIASLQTSASASSSGSGTSSDASTSSPSQDTLTLAGLLDKVLKQYTAVSADALQQGAGSLITTSA